jgi:hypothetical protein
MGLDEVGHGDGGHELGDRRPISFMLPRRFLCRPARRLFQGRLLRVGKPTAYDDGAASRADARHTLYYSRDIQLMRSATPSPQAPLRMSAPTMILGSQPPATPIPLSGNTTKSATALGPTAPISRARSQ